MQEELPNDLLRVDMLFKKAMEAGIDIQVCYTFLLESPQHESERNSEIVTYWRRKGKCYMIISFYLCFTVTFIMVGNN